VPKASIAMATTSDLSALNGPSLHFINLTNELSRLGHPISVLMPQPEAEPPIPFDREVRQIIGRVNVRRLGLPGTLSVAGMIPALGCIEVDALYLRASPASYFLTVAAKRRPSRVVIVEYNGWLTEEASALGYPAWACRLTCSLQLSEARRADRIRVVTSELKSILTSCGIPGEKITVVDNGTNTSMFRPLDKCACRRRLGIPGEVQGPVLTFVGNLWPAIDMATLFQALVLLRVRGRAARLLVVGNGPERQKLAEKAAALLPADVVRFLGGQAPETAAIAIGAADLGVAPFRRARNERVGLSPLKIRDYAAAGRPVVASELAGIKELASQPWLFLAEAENPDALATAINHCLDSNPAMLGKQARDYALANFSWAKVARSVSSLVCAAVSSRRATMSSN